MKFIKFFFVFRLAACIAKFKLSGLKKTQQLTIIKDTINRKCRDSGKTRKPNSWNSINSGGSIRQSISGSSISSGRSIRNDSTSSVS